MFLIILGFLVGWHFGDVRRLFQRKPRIGSWTLAELGAVLLYVAMIVYFFSLIYLTHRVFN